MSNIYFIAGTDTDVGKTFVSRLLLDAAGRLGDSAYGLKPVSAGCSLINGQAVNDDALILQSHSSVKLSYNQVNPIALISATSPHLAAEQENKHIRAADLIKNIQTTIHNNPAEWIFIESAGGWYTPISATESMADVAIGLGYPVILVVGMKLGCLNHARLSAEVIRQSGLKLNGFIANHIDPSLDLATEYTESVRLLLDTPLLLDLSNASI